MKQYQISLHLSHWRSNRRAARFKMFPVLTEANVQILGTIGIPPLRVGTTGQ